MKIPRKYPNPRVSLSILDLTHFVICEPRERAMDSLDLPDCSHIENTFCLSQWLNSTMLQCVLRSSNNRENRRTNRTAEVLETSPYQIRKVPGVCLVSSSRPKDTREVTKIELRSRRKIYRLRPGYQIKYAVSRRCVAESRVQS